MEGENGKKGVGGRKGEGKGVRDEMEFKLLCVGRSSKNWYS